MRDPKNKGGRMLSERSICKAIGAQALALALLAAPGLARSALILQMDASTLGLSNGQVVSTWGPASASGTPTYLTGQTPNGGAAVQFNGSDNFGQLGAAQFPASAAQDFIIAVVLRATNTGAYHNIVDDDASNRPMLWIDPANRYELNFAGGSGARAVGTGSGGWDIVIADSRNNRLYVNSGVSNATGGGAIPYAVAEPFDLFNRDGLQTYQGLIAELRIYNDAATFGNDFAGLYGELRQKWIPEPASALLLALGLLGIAGRRTYRRS
jgi:hypothetical protein